MKPNRISLHSDGDVPPEWSLLTYAGPFRFVGEQTFVELGWPRHSRVDLPERWEDIDAWVACASGEAV